MFIRNALLVCSLLFSQLLFAANEEKNPELLLKTSLTSFKIDQDVYLAFNLQHYDGWHTYWKNPGDAGLPTKFEWNLSDSIVEQEWPAPKRYIEDGDILTYGYGGDLSFFFKADKNKLEGKTLSLKATWLICKHICIPGQRVHTGTFKNGVFTEKDPASSVENIFQEILERRFQNLPKVQEIPENLEFKLAKGPSDNTVILYASWKGEGTPKDRNLLTPFPMRYLSFKKEQIISIEKSLQTRMSIDWDGIYVEPEIPMPADGKLSEPLEMSFIFTDPQTQKTSIINKTFTEFSPTVDNKAESIFKTTSTGPITPDGQIIKDHESNISVGFFTTLLFAFLGGLILNFMPCVLPVISLKLFGLIEHSKGPRSEIFKHNMAYSLGVLATFILLACTVLIIKASGENIGWGFQLQSPLFVGFMTIVIFVLGLNMFGLFEFQTPGGKVLGNVQTKKGFLGDFTGGVLATILSTPCSAPFLGTALTFAFTSGPIVIFVLFVAIGLGLAFPFILTAFFPKLVSFLPRPGYWMDHLKKFLGLTLFLTCVWLLDVFSALVENSALLMTLQTGLLFLFFAFYLRKSITKKRAWNIIAFVFPAIFFIYLTIGIQNNQVIEGAGTGMINDKLQTGLPWEPWSQEQMNKYKESGDIVFIDFTAKWCITCKVNEKLVLETNSFKEFVAKENIKLLLGDWTRRDQHITDFLQAHGMVGVPAYFVQKANGELINLGETITLSKIQSAMK